jgi:hypothetical protein
MLAVRCACGAVKGEVQPSRNVNRGSCYCKDCQAFAHFLGRADEILDAHGGTEVVQIASRHVRFTAGEENLACMRLTSKGLLRWYTTCCNTAIGNTLANPKLSFAGLVHTCLRANDSVSLDAAFGPPRLRVNTNSAKGDPKPKEKHLFGAIARLARMMLWARVSGGYRRSPFFASDGRPLARPRVLTQAELMNVRNAVRNLRATSR